MRFGRLMCFWQSLRPLFLCRHSDRKFSRRPPKPIASVVSGQCEKTNWIVLNQNMIALNHLIINKIKLNKNYEIYNSLLIRKQNWNLKLIIWKRNSSTTRKKRKPISGFSGERFTGKFFDFWFACFDRVFVSETRNSQNMLWNTHFESVNLKNYPLICDSFERELRVGESENFFGLENFGLREFLQNSGLKTKRTK